MYIDEQTGKAESVKREILTDVKKAEMGNPFFNKGLIKKIAVVFPNPDTAEKVIRYINGRLTGSTYKEIADQFDVEMITIYEQFPAAKKLFDDIIDIYINKYSTAGTTRGMAIKEIFSSPILTQNIKDSWPKK